jgi:hypothetical protein
VSARQLKEGVCHNPSLGLATKARGLQGCKPRGTLGRHFTCFWECKECEGMNPHIHKWTPMLGVRVPKRTSESSEHNCKGQNPLHGRVLYIIEKLLKCRCLKWACIAHLDICNTSYGQKKGWESNRQFDSRPLKVRNRPDFLACRWCATYHWKVLNERYNFALDFITIVGMHKKLCALKVAGVLNVGILGLPLGSHGTKSHLDVALVERCKVYYKGEGGGFPQVRAVMSLVCPNCLWFVLAPKVLQLCTNHLVLVLCTSVWVSKACHFFLVPSQSSNMPLYPSIMLRTRERAPIHCPFVIFNLGFTFESLKELGVRQSRTWSVLYFIWWGSGCLHINVFFCASFSALFVWSLCFFPFVWIFRK